MIRKRRGELPDGCRNRFPVGVQGMARAHAANACAQSDSIKGLAQSIAKPAYTRLLTAEPTLRRAVPTLIIAFLITICLGAFVQVLDQSRQKRAAAEARPHRAFRLSCRAHRSPRLGPAGPRLTNLDGMQSLLPDLIPAWGVAAGRHVIVVGADRRILARMPIKFEPRAKTTASSTSISSAQLLAAPSLQGKITDMTLPNGNGAMATSQLVKSLPGRVIVIQERLEPIWGSDFGALGNALRHHGLCRADPRLRLSLAIDPRPRRRPHQRRRARPDRYRAQPRPLRPVGLGPRRAAGSSGRNRCSPCWASTAATIS